mmetsp:Transcript_12534/g.18428  ORF Transcript_12534/g.18428 Transcript_12534/m.18428 type:complete len:95 (-) Transcript_12534:558-842(-)
MKQGSVPKTTSGKLRRVECQRRSLEGAWGAQNVLSSWTLDKLTVEPHNEPGETFEVPPLDRSRSKGDAIQGIFASILGVGFDSSSTWKELALHQ